MDAETPLQELRTRVQQFVEARHWDGFHTPKNLAMSIAIEAAELMEHFQWCDVDAAGDLVADPVQRAAIADELADVIIYCLSFANSAQIDVAAAVQAKMDRNEKRFPVP